METKTLTTLRADELQPGDHVKLIEGMGDCVVQGVRTGDDVRLLVTIIHWRECHGEVVPDLTGVWLWKYSRIEVLSDVKGRGHLATPMQVSVTESVSMDEVK